MYLFQALYAYIYMYQTGKLNNRKNPVKSNHI